jgi:tetratricopeptide (TPR) repeat protein
MHPSLIYNRDIQPVEINAVYLFRAASQRVGEAVRMTVMENLMTEVNRLIRRFGVVTLIAASLLSCAATGNRSTTAEPLESPQLPQTTAAGDEQQQALLPEQQLTDDLVFDILLAEIAGQRGELDTAVPHYLQAAENARDPRVAERAVQIASYAKQYAIAERAARRWVELAPDDLEAHKALTVLALHLGDADEALEQLDYLIKATDDPKEGYSLATALLARDSDKEAALTAMERLVAYHPESPYAWMALSRMSVNVDKLDKGLDAVNKALDLSPALPDAMMLKAQILVRLERKVEATQVLETAVSTHPDNAMLNFAYGRMLLDGDDLDGARKQFGRVVELDPENAEGLYSLALLELETKQYEAGERHLKQLLKLRPSEQNAYYYLGYSALDQGNSDAALQWYLKVEGGDYWSQSQLRIAEILVRQDKVDDMQNHMQRLRGMHPDQHVTLYLIEGQVLTDAGLNKEAFDLYGSALQDSPDNEELLYAHSLAAEKLGKLEIAERDMRRILKNDPENTRTLNALGYTLADRTNRYEEALTYIKRAYAQDPNDPAIIDSLGWVYFRLGKLDEAHRLLLQAWEMTGNSEIGAHLGEVLWAMGDREGAQRIWDTSLAADPGNVMLLKVINRYTP